MAQDLPQKPLKVVGIGVCGPREADRYMRETLEEFKRLCDETIIATCHATEKEISLIEEYGFHHYEDNREWGKEQPNIKTDLLTKAGGLKPDWIVALDMDEVFAPEFTREALEELAKGDEIGWYFLIVNLYNDRDHFAHSVGIQRFWNIRLYKYLPEYGLQFQRKALHCGLAPPIFYQYGWHAPFYVEHYGLMLPEDRRRKAERYDKYDPKAQMKGKVYYDELRKDLPSFEFDRPGLLRKLKASPDTQKRELPQTHPNSPRSKHARELDQNHR